MSDVLRMILGQGMAVIGVGLVLGLIAAFALMRLLESLLFGVGENDPITFGAITLLLLLVALFACYVPARRATKSRSVGGASIRMKGRPQITQIMEQHD